MSDASVTPTDYRRRSFLYRELMAAGARFGELNGAAIALAYGTGADELEQAQRLGLADLSPLPRAGFKGAGTIEWLTGQGIDVPAAANRAAPQPDAGLAARLSPGEVLLLSGLDGQSDAPERVERAWHDADASVARGFPVPRQDSHAWFAMTGRHGAALLAKLCGVDLRPAAFANHTIAQTSVARLSAIVIRHDLGATLNYFMLPDSASAAYLWACLLDAMTEFDATPVGLTALRGLLDAGVQ